MGVGVIDVQHRKIIRKIQDIHEAIENEAQQEKVIETIKFLGAYAEEHFRTEEEYMTYAGYSELSEHRKHHIEFRKKLDRFVCDIDEGKLDRNGLHNIGLNTYNWFVKHIQETDKRMGGYLKTKIGK